MVYWMLAFIALVLVGFALWTQYLFARRDSFWRHHDHLIPPASRSYRKAR